jgi:hypothetical protein
VKDKIHELATNSKNKNIRDLYRGINKFKSYCVCGNEPSGSIKCYETIE